MPPKTTDKPTLTMVRDMKALLRIAVPLDPDIRFMVPMPGEDVNFETIKRELTCARAILNNLQKALKSKPCYEEMTLSDLVDTGIFSNLDQYLNGHVFNWNKFVP